MITFNQFNENLNEDFKLPTDANFKQFRKKVAKTIFDEAQKNEINFKIVKDFMTQLSNHSSLSKDMSFLEVYFK